MKRFRLRILLGLMLCLALTVGACATAEETVFDPYNEEQSEAVVQRLASELAATQLEYAPKVTELENGVRIQRTPSDDGIYNTYVLKGDQRGCNACHTDLRETLNNLPMGHMDLNFVGDTQVTVTQCISCHTYSPGYVPEYYEFGTLIHGLHQSTTFKNMGGDCMSCHDANESTGKMLLWDQVKYSLFRGVVDLPAEDAPGTFVYDQTTLSNEEDAFSLNWLVGPNDFNIYEDYTNGYTTSQETFDNWEITVDGMVDHPFTMTLKEMIETFPSIEKVMTMHCTLDPATGGLITTAKVKGISIKALLEKAGVQDGAIEFYTHPIDDACVYPTPIEWMNDHDGLLVYELNGKPLRVFEGYPVASWEDGIGAPSFAKQLNRIEVAADPIEDAYLYVGWIKENGETYFNKPNIGVMNTRDGQIITAGESYTVEGWTHAYDDPIVKVEVSMDRGATWQTFEIPDMDVAVWLHWNYTFTPSDAGAYVFTARSVTASGLVSDTPVTVMVNAEN